MPAYLNTYILELVIHQGEMLKRSKNDTIKLQIEEIQAQLSQPSSFSS